MTPPPGEPGGSMYWRTAAADTEPTLATKYERDHRVGKFRPQVREFLAQHTGGDALELVRDVDDSPLEKV